MRLYIDYENVGNAGLVGIESLTNNDCVRIYYSNNPSVDMHTVESISHSPAKKQFVRLPDSLKMMNHSNALDIVILTDIAKIAADLGSNYAIVISKDKGYDAVISEIKQTCKTNNIIRLDSIQSWTRSSPESLCAASKSIDNSALNELFNQSLSKFVQRKSEIVDIVKTSKSRCEINNRVQHSFDMNQSRIIMGALKPIIIVYPGQ